MIPPSPEERICSLNIRIVQLRKERDQAVAELERRRRLTPKQWAGAALIMAVLVLAALIDFAADPPEEDGLPPEALVELEKAATGPGERQRHLRVLLRFARERERLRVENADLRRALGKCLHQGDQGQP